MPKDIMLDLETMSTQPNAAIVSIGAVVVDFENNCLGDEFYATNTLKSAVETGGAVDIDTVMWWLAQSKAAQNEIATATQHISRSLDQFEEWVRQYGPGVRVWGNGATFDNVLLRNTYLRQGRLAPWGSKNDRCFRTLREGLPTPAVMPLDGISHNALSDAKWQGQYLLELRREADARRQSDLETAAMYGGHGLPTGPSEVEIFDSIEDHTSYGD